MFFSRSKDPLAKRLSAFGPDDVMMGGKLYPTVEHAFHAAKALMAGSEALAEEIRGVPTPQEAKTLGSRKTLKTRRIRFNLEEWESCREDVMRGLLKNRFDRHPDLWIACRALPENTQFFHYSLRNRIWGCHVDHETGQVKKGLNKMGVLMGELVWA